MAVHLQTNIFYHLYLSSEGGTVPDTTDNPCVIRVRLFDELFQFYRKKKNNKNTLLSKSKIRQKLNLYPGSILVISIVCINIVFFLLLFVANNIINSWHHSPECTKSGLFRARQNSTHWRILKKKSCLLSFLYIKTRAWYMFTLEANTYVCVFAHWQYVSVNTWHMCHTARLPSH